MINLRIGEQEGKSSRIGCGGRKGVCSIITCLAGLSLSLWGGKLPARRVAVFGISAPEHYFHFPLSDVYAGVMARLDRKSESRQYRVIESEKIMPGSTGRSEAEWSKQGKPPIPEIPFEEADYVIYGGITDRVHGTVIELFIAAAGNGDQIKTIIIPYDTARSGFENGFLAAGRFGSLTRILKAFEARKRNQNPRIAIGPQPGKHLLINPQKTFVNTGETFPVKLQLCDFDGTPLKARRLVLGAANGRFDRRVVMTGEDGKGEAMFTAGDEAGFGRLQVRFTYDYPWGHPGELMETTKVRIIPFSILVIENELESVTQDGDNYSKLNLRFKIQAELAADQIETEAKTGDSIQLEYFKLNKLEIKSYNGTFEYREIKDGQLEKGKCRVTDAFMDYYIDNLTVLRDPLTGKARMVIIPELNVEYLLSGTERCEGDHPEYFTLKALEPYSAPEMEEFNRSLGDTSGKVLFKGRYFKDHQVRSGDGLKEWGGEGESDATLEEGRKSVHIHQKYNWKVKVK